MITAYIADDEVWVVLGLKKQLEKTGFPVKVVGTANNGLTAKEEIGSLKPDIVFTDIRMPGENGLDLLHDIGNESPESRVVIVSGYADFSYAKEAISGHAYDYLVKPVHQEELESLIDKLQKELEPELSEEEARQEAEVIHEENATDVDRVIKRIRANYTKEINLTDLAEEFGMSAATLSTQLKEKLSMTFSNYVTSLRIQKAKELLKNPMISIQEVAEMAGYTDYFYFTKVFKKVEGISPSKYRKEL
ncbi:two component transcriptional regulator, AraC family [Lachnospiraceae bacterium KH1T2]|nr:two component transcriptional regulator, AraC family [Lachnospiraceae bacterium KH1T2]